LDGEVAVSRQQVEARLEMLEGAEFPVGLFLMADG
jgi:hypothetical protein